MTIRAFQGGAGCGKTYRLMRTLAESLTDCPLASGQRVLALTFMHGSRRRLDDRLRELGHAYECATIDSFALRVVTRWRSLADHLGHALPLETEYGTVCAVAAALLEQPSVVGWVAASHPIALLDEAQDLTEERLRIVRALEARLTLLVAADEFQCLNEGLRPNPFCSW
ncbi:AAA family ATPase [Azospirillum canadense]|uniref:AAA family ATPase n=1 Tax=Azospirillum canadense TaxID=403962 RepID=UPI002227CF36|nr:AAA family ATPase [Azospirillum canadense]MCW2240419.1 superfamily I DNA/RNA helicase [Azospirillum canadense]